MMPICSSSARRRGEPEASTSFGRCSPALAARAVTATRLLTGAASVSEEEDALFEPIRNPSLSEIIGRHLDQNLVAGKHPDAVFVHAASGMGNNLVLVLELHPEGGVGEEFGRHPWKFEHFFLRHKSPSGGSSTFAPENGRV